MVIVAKGLQLGFGPCLFADARHPCLAHVLQHGHGVGKALCVRRFALPQQVKVGL